jgi:hypothetical protein
MLTANNTIFSSEAALNGAWRNIQNWINFSLQVTGIEGNVWVEVSNDPNVLTDGATISAPAAPVLSQYTPISDGGVAPYTGTGLAGVPVNTTYYVKNTYVTPNSLNPTGGVSPVYPGETTASAETSLLVTAGNLLVVQPPAQDAGKVAIGWNTYISTTSGTERLQNLVDNAVGSALEFGQTFPVVNYGLTFGPLTPGSNTSTSAASGVNLTGNLASFPAASYTPGTTGTGLNQVQVLIPSGTGMAMINPSGIIWNFIRVCKDSTANTKVTTAYLFGQSA